MDNYESIQISANPLPSHPESYNPIDPSYEPSIILPGNAENVHLSSSSSYELQPSFALHHPSSDFMNTTLPSVSSSSNSDFSIIDSLSHLHSPRTVIPLDYAEILQIFHRHELFPTVSETFLHRLINRMERINCVPGQLIYLEGDYTSRNPESLPSSTAVCNEGPGAIVPSSVSVSFSPFFSPNSILSEPNATASSDHSLAHYALYIVIQGSCEVRTRTHTYYMKNASSSSALSNSASSYSDTFELTSSSFLSQASSTFSTNNLSASLKSKKRASTWLLQPGDIFGELALVADHVRKETVRAGPYGATLFVLDRSVYHTIRSIPEPQEANNHEYLLHHHHHPQPKHRPTSLNKISKSDSGTAVIFSSTASPSQSSSATLPLLSELQHVHTIGIGSFGKVTLVRSNRTNKIYALKCIHRANNHTTLENHHQALYMEQWVLQHVHHPFLLSLVTSYEDEENTYLLTEYVSGGELFSLLAPPDEGGIGPSLSFVHGRFLIASLVDALAYLHSITLGKLIYRDLKLENILLDDTGYVKLCDFGFTTQLLSRDNQRAITLCGTPEYLAPEIIQISRDTTTTSSSTRSPTGTTKSSERGYTEVVDWWSLGVLTYEIFVGYTPFATDHNESALSDSNTNVTNDNSPDNTSSGNPPSAYPNPISIFRRIIQGKLNFPDTFTDYHARDFIRQLLRRNPQERLGYASSDSVRNHSWFTSSLRGIEPNNNAIDPSLYEPIDWDKLRKKEYCAPWKPELESPEDTHYFDRYSEHETKGIHEDKNKVDQGKMDTLLAHF